METAKNAMGTVAEKAKDMAGAASEMASNMADSAKEKLSGMKGKVTHASLASNLIFLYFTVSSNEVRPEDIDNIDSQLPNEPAFQAGRNLEINMR